MTSNGAKYISALVMCVRFAQSRKSCDINNLTYSVIQVKQIRIILSMISLGIGDYFADVFANIGTFENMSKGSKTPAFTFRAEQLEPLSEAVLNYSIVASNAIAIASWVAFEQHRWIYDIKSAVNVDLKKVHSRKVNAPQSYSR